MQPIEGIILTVSCIGANLTRKIDPGMIVQAVHYSKYHLHRVFSHTVRLIIHNYIQRGQLTEAGKLLVFLEKSVVEIAPLSGYQSQQTFANTFTSMYKVPPNRYREKEKFYPLQLKLGFDGRYDILRRLENRAWDIRCAAKEDIFAWMELVRLVIGGFPNLQGSTYIETLRQRIRTNQALIVKDGVTAVGILLFSWDTGSTDFVGCHPLYRRMGISRAFLDKVAGELLIGQEISITAFRKGDKVDNGQRREIQGLGSAETELLEEHGYPTQWLVLSQEAQKDG